MKKRFILCVLTAIAVFAVAVGCSDTSIAPKDPGLSSAVDIDGLGIWYATEGTKAGTPQLALGVLHNEVMRQLNLQFPYPYDPSKSAIDDIDATSKTAIQTRFPNYSSADYDSMLAMVRQFKVDGQFDLTLVLSGPEGDWWNGLLSACSGATSSAAVRASVSAYGVEHGLPLPGTKLAYGVSTLIHSADFWFDEVGIISKKNPWSAIMADAGGGMVGWNIGEKVGMFIGRPDAAAWGFLIGGICGSAGYLIG